MPFWKRTAPEPASERRVPLELRLRDGMYVRGTARSLNHLRTLILAADLLAEHAQRVGREELHPRALDDPVEAYRRIRGKP